MIDFKKYLLPAVLVGLATAAPSAVADDKQLLDGFKSCYKGEDYACAYKNLIEFLNTTEKEVKLIEPTFGMPAQMGVVLERAFLMAVPTMSPEEVRDQADDLISRVSDGSKHPQVYVHLMPYYVVQTEACLTLNDQSCLQESMAMLCQMKERGEFSWPKAPQFNTPLEGRERALKATGDCSKYNMSNFKPMVELKASVAKFQAILSGDDQEAKYAVTLSPESNELRKKQTPEERKPYSYESYTASIAEELSYFDQGDLILSRQGDEYQARYEYVKDPNYPTRKNGHSLNTVNGEWVIYLY